MFKQSEQQFKEPPDKPLEYRTIALVIKLPCLKMMMDINIVDIPV